MKRYNWKITEELKDWVRGIRRDSSDGSHYKQRKSNRRLYSRLTNIIFLKGYRDK